MAAMQGWANQISSFIQNVTQWLGRAYQITCFKTVRNAKDATHAAQTANCKLYIYYMQCKQQPRKVMDR